MYKDVHTLLSQDWELAGIGARRVSDNALVLWARGNPKVRIPLRIVAKMLGVTTMTVRRRMQLRRVTMTRAGLTFAQVEKIRSYKGIRRRAPDSPAR